MDQVIVPLTDLKSDHCSVKGCISPGLKFPVMTVVYDPILPAVIINFRMPLCEAHCRDMEPTEIAADQFWEVIEAIFSQRKLPRPIRELSVIRYEPLILMPEG